MKKKIALIFDFDDTLCLDSTTGFLKANNLDTRKFWKETSQLIQCGFDPVLAYMNLMIQKSKLKSFRSVFLKSGFASFGKTIRFFPGVKRLFQHFRKFTSDLDKNAEIRFYLISSGLETILKNSGIAFEFEAIFSSAFHFSDTGQILLPKRVVSFTDKTRFLFAISKGIHPDDYFNAPSKVNEKHKSGKFDIPFSNMIFIGDGFSDIPCFALLKAYGGYGIGVYRKHHMKTAESLINDERVRSIASVDYTLKGKVKTQMENYIKKILN